MVEPDVQVYWAPKLGNDLEEYEDAYAGGWPFYAVADGATESSFADLWASSLVNEFVRERPSLQHLTGEDLARWLEPIQGFWRQQIRWDQLPWYAEEKAHAGAFATLLGLEFVELPPPSPKLWSRWFGAQGKPRPRFRWRSFAVGDSCLFVVRNNRMLRAVPIDNSKNFSPRPLLLSSRADRNHEVCRQIRVVEGECQPDDWFFLATDALSLWFLKQNEAGKKPWERLIKIQAQEEFDAFTAKLREGEGMRNDDTTLMAIRWPADLPAEPEPSS